MCKLRKSNSNQLSQFGSIEEILRQSNLIKNNLYNLHENLYKWIEERQSQQDDWVIYDPLSCDFLPQAFDGDG